MLGPSPVCVVLAALLMAGTLAGPATAEILPFRATLTVFAGPEPGVLLQSTLPVHARGSAHYTQSGFTLPTGAFMTSHFTPIATTVGGSVPLDGAVLDLPGRPTAAPAKRGGGVRSPPGASTTVVSTAVILGNRVTVTVFAEGWTTGTIRYDDRSKGTLHPTRANSPITNPTLTAGTARGSRELGRYGGSISLVTPLVIRVPNTAPNLLAGYARLDILFGERALVPEPALSTVLACAAALVALGRARRRPRV